MRTNKALQLTRRHHSACGSPPAGGRPVGGRFAGRPPDVSSRFTGGAQLRALSVRRRVMLLKFCLPRIALTLTCLLATVLPSGAFEPRKDDTFERGYYVPIDFDDALRSLDVSLSAVERESFRST